MTLTGEAKLLYQKNWTKMRRQAWIDQNGPCAVCNSQENLEVDHIDPKEKLYDVGELWNLSLTNLKRISELAKCQVLCFACHKKKTLTDGNITALKTHCRRGHELVLGNLYIHPGSGRRECLTCKKNRRKSRILGSNG